MRTVAMILPLAFVTQAREKELAAKMVDKLVDKLVDNLFDKVLSKVVSPVCGVDLDGTTLWNSGHLAISPQMSLSCMDGLTLRNPSHREHHLRTSLRPLPPLRAHLRPIPVLRSDSASPASLEFNSMRSSQLKTLLKSKGINVDGCFDKESLVERAEEHRSVLERPTVTEKPTAQKKEPDWQPNFYTMPTVENWPGGAPIEQGPSEDAKASLILLHGFGDSGGGFISQFGGPLIAMEGLRVIFPSAPALDVGGFKLSSWIDPQTAGGAMAAPQAMMRADDNMVRRPVKYVHELILREMRRGVEPRRIVVGGFSQGGMVAIRAALSFPGGPLGGALALSTFFGAEELTGDRAQIKLKVFVAHGKADGMVPPSEGLRVESCIRNIVPLANVTCKLYDDMGHATCPEQVSDLRAFLESVIKEADWIRKEAPAARNYLKGMADIVLEDATEADLRAVFSKNGISAHDCIDKDDLLAKYRKIIGQPEESKRVLQQTNTDEIGKEY